VHLILEVIRTSCTNHAVTTGFQLHPLATVSRMCVIVCLLIVLISLLLFLLQELSSGLFYIVLVCNSNYQCIHNTLYNVVMQCVYNSINLVFRFLGLL